MLTPSLEDYLKTIMLLEQKKGSARPIDIAKAMRVGKPSSSLALRRLKERGLIAHDAYGEATLTQEGKKMAERILLRHEALREFFESILGIPKDQADANAHRLEHVIDEDVLSRLIALTNILNKSLKVATPLGVDHGFPAESPGSNPQEKNKI